METYKTEEVLTIPLDLPRENVEALVAENIDLMKRAAVMIVLLTRKVDTWISVDVTLVSAAHIKDGVLIRLEVTHTDEIPAGDERYWTKHFFQSAAGVQCPG